MAGKKTVSIPPVPNMMDLEMTAGIEYWLKEAARESNIRTATQAFLEEQMSKDAELEKLKQENLLLNRKLEEAEQTIQMIREEHARSTRPYTNYSRDMHELKYEQYCALMKLGFPNIAKCSRCNATRLQVEVLRMTDQLATKLTVFCPHCRHAVHSMWFTDREIMCLSNSNEITSAFRL